MAAPGPVISFGRRVADSRIELKASELFFIGESYMLIRLMQAHLEHIDELTREAFYSS